MTTRNTLLWLLAFAALSGCAPMRKKVASSINKPDAPQLSVEQETFRKAATVTADQLMPLVSRSATFRYEIGPKAGETVGYYMTTDGNGAWFSTLDSLVSLQLRRDGDGALLVDGVADYQRGRFVQYDPPMRLLPPTMKHLTVVVRQTTMLVRKKPDGKVKDRVQCSYKVQLLGMQRVPTGQGERDVYIVRIDRTIDPGMSQTTDTTWLGFDPQLGLVAQRYEKQGRTLGVLTRESYWSLVYDQPR